MLAAIRKYASKAERGTTEQRGQGAKLVEGSPVPSGSLFEVLFPAINPFWKITSD
jgi:hypothetical protein